MEELLEIKRELSLSLVPLVVGFQKNKPSTPGVREKPFSVTEPPQLLFVQACSLPQTNPKVD